MGNALPFGGASDRDCSELPEWSETLCCLREALRALNREKAFAEREFLVKEQLCLRRMREGDERAARLASRVAVERANTAWQCQHRIVQADEVRMLVRRVASSQPVPKPVMLAAQEFRDAAKALDFVSMKHLLDEMHVHFPQLSLFEQQRQLDTDALIELFEVDQMLAAARDMCILERSATSAAPRQPEQARKGVDARRKASLATPSETDLGARLHALLHS